MSGEEGKWEWKNVERCAGEWGGRERWRSGSGGMWRGVQVSGEGGRGGEV